MQPFGFSTKSISISGFTLTFAGILESIGLGIVSDRTKRYKLIYISMTSLSLGIVALLYFVLDYK